MKEKKRKVVCIFYVYYVVYKRKQRGEIFTVIIVGIHYYFWDGGTVSDVLVFDRCEDGDGLAFMNSSKMYIYIYI